MKKITIATAHSQNYERGKDQKMEIEMQGGSPYFRYIWIDDVLFAIYKTTKTVKIKKLK